MCSANRHRLCRYLLRAPPSAFDTAHRVRLAMGNGLRPDVWRAFQARFNVRAVGEFYGSSEGNVALFNTCTPADLRRAPAHSHPPRAAIPTGTATMFEAPPHLRLTEFVYIREKFSIARKFSITRYLGNV